MPAGRITAGSGGLRQTAAKLPVPQKKRPKGPPFELGNGFCELNILEQLEYVLRLGVSLRQHRHC